MWVSHNYGRFFAIRIRKRINNTDSDLGRQIDTDPCRYGSTSLLLSLSIFCFLYFTDQIVSPFDLITFIFIGTVKRFWVAWAKGLVLNRARQLRPFSSDPKIENLFTVMLYVRQKLIMHKRILKYCCGCLL